MHVQSCCFASLNLLVFFRSRCRQRRRCLSSLLACEQALHLECQAKKASRERATLASSLACRSCVTFHDIPQMVNSLAGNIYISSVLIPFST